MKQTIKHNRCRRYKKGGPTESECFQHKQWQVFVNKSCCPSPCPSINFSSSTISTPNGGAEIFSYSTGGKKENPMVPKYISVRVLHFSDRLQIYVLQTPYRTVESLSSTYHPEQSILSLSLRLPSNKSRHSSQHRLSVLGIMVVVNHIQLG